MRRFAIGDLHGQIDAFHWVLEAVNFNNEKDQLFVLGDIYDYGVGTCEIIERILQIRNKVVIRGNHDMVFHVWARSGHHLYNWSHGGAGTLKSYSNFHEIDFDFSTNMMHRVYVPEKHLKFLDQMQDYHITKDSIMFCHAGFDLDYTIDQQIPDEFYNNRSFFKKARKQGVVHDFKTVFVGHTITEGHEPFISDNVVNLDTGAKASNRPLTLMDIDTREYVQSYLKNY